jgi:heptosyltransferase I
MRILLVKMSSMGDIFHTFPALSDLRAACPNARIDWVVERNFAEMAAWHPAVDRIIPITQRRWLKQRDRAAWREFTAWRRALRETEYDLVIDAQALIKSMIVSRCARAKRVAGYDKHSLREKPASWGYNQRIAVSTELHAVTRARELMAKALGYTVPAGLDFGIRQHFAGIPRKPRSLVLIVGTSWTTKLWQPEHWCELANIAVFEDYEVEVVWGSPEEHALAQKIVAACPGAHCPEERLSIEAVAQRLVAATGVIGLDTGFAHLAGALETPTIALYGATSPAKVGLIGDHTCNLQLEQPLDCMPCHKRSCRLLPENSTDTPPCMSGISAGVVWSRFSMLLGMQAGDK